MNKISPPFSPRRLPAWAACAAACFYGASAALAEDPAAAPAKSDKPEKTDKADKSEKSAEKTEAKADETPKAESDYRNWSDVSIGGDFIRGSAAQFMENRQVPKGAYGGISDFHYEQDVGKKGLFEVDGRGIFDNHDYS